MKKFFQLTPTYGTSFSSIFRARRDGDIPTADFTDFHGLSRTFNIIFYNF